MNIEINGKNVFMMAAVVMLDPYDEYKHREWTYIHLDKEVIQNLEILCEVKGNVLSMDAVKISKDIKTDGMWVLVYYIVAYVDLEFVSSGKTIEDISPFPMFLCIDGELYIKWILCPKYSKTVLV